MRDRHAHRGRSRFPKQAPIFPSRPCSPIGKPANDPRGKCRTDPTAGSIARLATRHTLMRFVVAIAPLMCDGTGSAFLESSPRAHTAVRSEAVDRVGNFLEEASVRFAIPARWIR